MPFPNVNRVVFNNNPLVEVVCQLNFSTPYSESDFSLLSIGKIHELIKDQFPIFQSGQQLRLSIDISGGANNKEELKSFSFFSADKDWTIILTRESFVIATRNYTRWEEFSKKINDFIENALFNSISKKSFRRVGLRYKDVIRRSSLRLTSSDWSDLLNERIAAPLSDQDLIKDIEGYQSSLNISLGKNEGFLNANYGIVLHNESKEQCFMIDGDCYYEGEFDYDGAREKLEQFNSCSRKHFRWAISEQLFQALGPTTP